MTKAKAALPLDAKTALRVVERAAALPWGADLAVQTVMRNSDLPRHAETVLRKMQADVSKLKVHAEKLQETLVVKLAYVKTLEQVKRNLSAAREGFKKAGKFDAAVGIALDDLYGIADERMKLYKLIHRSLIVEHLWPLRRMTGRHGAPGLPVEILAFGAEAVNGLMKIGVKRLHAARAVAKCLQPFIPHRSRENYSFNAEQLLRNMRRHRLLTS